MITLIRWYMMKRKQIKIKLAFWTFVEQMLVEVTKNGDKLEEKLMGALIKVIHDGNKRDEGNK